MSRKLFQYKGVDLNFGVTPTPLHNYTQNYRQPVLIYDTAVIKERVEWIQKWKNLGRLHYAMKANFNLEILKLFKQLDCGLDVVSLGEMQWALQAGFKPQDFIFSGVAKSITELQWAIENEIYQINIESLSELKKIIQIADQKNKLVSVGLRINPEIDAETHPSIATALKDSKFGLDFTTAQEAVQIIAGQSRVQLKAISFHLGSQILNVKVFEKALKIIKPFYKQAKKVCPDLDRLDLGGGLGIDYKSTDLDQDHKRWIALVDILNKELVDFDAHYLLEMGRFLVARSAVLISRIEVIKRTSSNKKFLILDVGMSHLLRPALYQAYHEIFSLKLKSGAQSFYDVVGPICESTDVIVKNKSFSALDEGDFVAICDVGAYGSSMASRYNLRDEAIEILI